MRLGWEEGEKKESIAIGISWLQGDLESTYFYIPTLNQSFHFILAFYHYHPCLSKPPSYKH